MTLTPADVEAKWTAARANKLFKLKSTIDKYLLDNADFDKEFNFVLEMDEEYDSNELLVVEDNYARVGWVARILHKPKLFRTKRNLIRVELQRNPLWP